MNISSDYKSINTAVNVNKNTKGSFFCSYFNKLRNSLYSPFFFLGLAAVITSLLTLACAQFILWEKGNTLLPSIWLSGFCILSFDLSLNVLCALYYRFTPPLILNEVKLQNIPSCAIVFPVRNEDVGLYERIAYSMENNNLQNSELWFLSDSSHEYLEYENEVIIKLRARFGENKINYIHRRNPVNAKPGNIENWLNKNAHKYKYFLVCDADSILPKNALLKLLRKAEHPDNQDIGIFQTRIEITHAKTIFSKHQALGIRISQKLYTNVKQSIFKGAISYGHGNLIRMRSFLNIDVPKGALSHDIWDMSLMSANKIRTIFCPDVISYEESPSNYLELRKRDRRWIKGNFQSLQLLKRNDLSLAAYFYVAYGSFVYLLQPLFLGWVILSLLGNSSFAGQFLYFHPLIGVGPFVDLYVEPGFFTTGVLSLVYLHKFVICGTFKDAYKVMSEICLSTVISLNNIIYQSIDIVYVIFQSVQWVPMKKNPFESTGIISTAKALWPGTLTGICILIFIFKHNPALGWVTLPLTFSFTLSIPIIYFTSLTINMNKG